MGESIRLVWLVLAVFVCTARVGTSEAAEIKLLCANGMREVVQDLGPKFERATGHTLAVSFATLGAIVDRVQKGETADLVTLPRQGIERLYDVVRSELRGVGDRRRTAHRLAQRLDAT